MKASTIPSIPFKFLYILKHTLHSSATFLSVNARDRVIFDVGINYLQQLIDGIEQITRILANFPELIVSRFLK